jgi:hypothetical protein
MKFGHPIDGLSKKRWPLQKIMAYYNIPLGLSKKLWPITTSLSASPKN